MSAQFDRWLDDELGASLSRAAGPADAPVNPRYASATPRRAPWGRLGIGAGVPLALTLKTAAALAAAALATGGAAAVVVSQHATSPGNGGSQQNTGTQV